jgi:hypothetical protein
LDGEFKKAGIDGKKYPGYEREVERGILIVGH